MSFVSTVNVLIFPCGTPRAKYAISQQSKFCWKVHVITLMRSKHCFTLEWIAVHFYLIKLGVKNILTLSCDDTLHYFWSCFAPVGNARGAGGAAARCFLISTRTHYSEQWCIKGHLSSDAQQCYIYTTYKACRYSSIKIMVIFVKTVLKSINTVHTQETSYNNKPPSPKLVFPPCIARTSCDQSIN